MSDRIHIYVPTFAGGGAERIFIRIANVLSAAGAPVTFLVNNESGPLRRLLADHVPLASLGARRTRNAFGKLVGYFRKERPSVIICGITVNNLSTLAACLLTGSSTRIVICERNQLSRVLAQYGLARRLIVRGLVRKLYPRASAITAVSGGVAKDVATISGVAPDRIMVIHNPPPEPEDVAAARANPSPHPWFEGDAPVMVAVGRLHPQKRYDLLLQALADVRRTVDLKLIILGEGAQGPELAELAQRLGVAEHVAFEGFVLNRLDYLVRARLYALTSDYEGFPNALVEALACGAPVVSTDCAGEGPSEILRPTLASALIPTGDADALAHAILAELASPTDAALLAQVTRHMSIEAAAQRFLALARGSAP